GNAAAIRLQLDILTSFLLSRPRPRRRQLICLAVIVLRIVLCSTASVLLDLHRELRISAEPFVPMRAPSIRCAGSTCRSAHLQGVTRAAKPAALHLGLAIQKIELVGQHAFRQAVRFY